MPSNEQQIQNFCSVYFVVFYPDIYQLVRTVAGNKLFITTYHNRTL